MRRQTTRLVRLVNKIIVEAYQQGASDIHIEPRPGKEKTLIRFRQDGSLGQLYRSARFVPQCPGRSHQDHVRPRYFGKCV